MKSTVIHQYMIKMHNRRVCVTRDKERYHILIIRLMGWKEIKETGFSLTEEAGEALVKCLCCVIPDRTLGREDWREYEYKARNEQ